MSDEAISQENEMPQQQSQAYKQDNVIDTQTRYTSEMIDGSQAGATSWQKWLFGIGMFFTIVVFASFAYITINQIENVQSSIDKAPMLDDAVLIKSLKMDAETDDKTLVYKNLVLLENETIKKRYHNANVILKAQIVIKYLGFLTGMILSVLGAVFILGKFREFPIALNAKGEIVKNGSLQFQSTSPGIFLALIGAIIMMTTILKTTEIKVDDNIVYIGGQLKNKPPAGNSPNQSNPPEKPADFDSGLLR